jgi:hypothetical protein
MHSKKKIPPQLKVYLHHLKQQGKNTKNADLMNDLAPC